MTVIPQEFSLHEQITHSINGCYLIEASAGTGKTYTISNLFLRHILEGRQVGELLVVTFTTAATDELKGRIRQRLYQARHCLESSPVTDEFIDAWMQQHNVATEVLRQRLLLAVRSMDEAAIYTIHGFCQKILAEFAFLGGQPYQLELNNDKRQWLEPAILDWWRVNIAWQQNQQWVEIYQQLKWTQYEQFKKIISPLLEKQIEFLPDEQDIYTRLQQNFATLKKIWREQSITEKLIEKSCYEKRVAKLKDNYLIKNKPLIDQWFDEKNPASFIEPLQSYSFALLSSKLKKSAKPQDLPDIPFYQAVDKQNELLQLKQDCIIADTLRRAQQEINRKSAQIKEKQQQLAFQDLLLNLRNALYQQHAPALLNAIRQKFPVAFIDEFQDTDPVQYAIFKKIYLPAKDTALYLIGDPKQAIYGFRGGDIDTYMQAKTDIMTTKGKILTLQTNWRSTPQMVSAVNSVFNCQGESAFLYPGMIPFYPVNACSEAHKQASDLQIAGEKITPLNFHLVENYSETAKPLNKEESRAIIDQHLANQIVDLLNQAKNDQAKLGNKTLCAADIAILVPKNNDALRLQKILKKQGVASVIASNESVFNSEQADAIAVLLYAVLHYQDHQAQRNALASPLLALGYQEIEQILLDETAWSQWCLQLKKLHDIWQKQGFMTLFLVMLQSLNVLKGIKRRANEDRDLTNLMHLAELIQQASKKHNSAEALYDWFIAKRTQEQQEESEIRLESDANLVQIVTLHKSKGLEYGVVFLPYLWDLVINKDTFALFHDPDHKLVLDCNQKTLKTSQVLADYERLAEHLRLVYVALTRSVACCHVYWGNLSGAGQSALAWLLHSRQALTQLKQQKWNCVEIQDDAQIEQDLQKLSNATVERVSPSEAIYLSREENKNPLFQVRQMQNRVDRHWQVSSFSALTKKMPYLSTNTEGNNVEDVIFNFPAGKSTGRLLHELLEVIDFQQDIKQQLSDVIENKCLLHGFSLEQSNIILEWLNNIIHTPFNQDGLSLADLSQGYRLNEMPFYFRLNKTRVDDFVAIIKQYYPKSRLGIEPLAMESVIEGMMTGIIDLVFESNGRFYLLDYKTNLLGKDFAAYNPAQLKQAITAHHYELQYLLYTVALHLYLASRLKNYHYKKHFGGVYYLFVRAMRPSNPAGYGSFFDKPEEALIETLASLLNDNAS